MSADWFFLKASWFRRSRRIGPLSEADLIRRIDRGEIGPETLLLSSSKTRGRWVRMAQVAPAIRHWKKTHAPKESSN